MDRRGTAAGAGVEHLAGIERAVDAGGTGAHDGSIIWDAAGRRAGGGRDPRDQRPHGIRSVFELQIAAAWLDDCDGASRGDAAFDRDYGGPDGVDQYLSIGRVSRRRTGADP